MIGFLAVVAVLSYLFSAFAFFLAFGGSDIQFILAGVFATCGTCAAAGGAIAERVDAVAALLRTSLPKPATPDTLSAEGGAGM
jgi:hypothetical protein